MGYILDAGDGGIVSKSAEGLAKMMTVVVTVFEAAGLTVSQNGDYAAAGTEPGTPDLTARPRSSGGTEVETDDAVFCNWAVLSSQTMTVCQRSYNGSDSHGHATFGSNGSCMIWRMSRSLLKCACYGPR